MVITIVEFNFHLPFTGYTQKPRFTLFIFIISVDVIAAILEAAVLVTLELRQLLVSISGVIFFI